MDDVVGTKMRPRSITNPSTKVQSASVVPSAIFCFLAMISGSPSAYLLKSSKRANSGREMAWTHAWSPSSSRRDSASVAELSLPGLYST